MNTTMEERQRATDNGWAQHERRQTERVRFAVPVPPRVGVDSMGRCLVCGLPVLTSAGCECTKENKNEI